MRFHCTRTETYMAPAIPGGTETSAILVPTRVLGFALITSSTTGLPAIPFPQPPALLLVNMLKPLPHKNKLMQEGKEGENRREGGRKGGRKRGREKGREREGGRRKEIEKATESFLGLLGVRLPGCLAVRYLAPEDLGCV